MASWLEKVKTQFIIVTGDGAGYFPNWVNANLSVSYNVSVFNFRNLDGSFIDKQRPQGAVYNMEVIFQGANHIDTAQAFRKSAADRRPWTIQHPLYGKLYVQPIDSLFFDNSQNNANITIIRGPVMETIGASKITFTTSAPDVIAAAKITTDQAYTDVYVTAVPDPGVKDTNAMLSNLKKMRDIVVKSIRYTHDAELYANHYAAVANAIQGNVVGEVGNIITGLQSFVSAPATFTDSIINRILFLQHQFNMYAAQVDKIQDYTIKHLWMNNAGTCLTAICLAATYNIQPTDYPYAFNATNIIQKIIESYNSYVQLLDQMQSINGGQPFSFIPDVAALTNLNNLINYTVTTLLTIAVGAKQQRIITLTRDNNWINIAYQLYGLLPDDSTITQIMQENNVCLNEIMQVKAGRQVIYYV